MVRTTLDIDEDVLAAARELARVRKSTAGQVISELARQALTQPSEQPLEKRNGFWVLPRRGGIVTREVVRQLQEED